MFDKHVLKHKFSELLVVLFHLGEIIGLIILKIKFFYNVNTKTLNINTKHWIAFGHHQRTNSKIIKNFTTFV